MNMYVDHSIVSNFQNLVPFVVPAVFMLFGVVVAVIQAFVFTILTTVYVQMAIEHEH